MTLPDDEQADLRIAFDTGWLTLLAHVTDLCDAYRAQGYVMGDLAHDGTLHAQVEAEADDVEPLQKCLRCLHLCEPGFACVDGENPSCPRPCRPVAEGGRIR